MFINKKPIAQTLSPVSSQKVRTHVDMLNTSTARLAITSRLLVILIQFAANQLFPDHDANVFVSPSSDQHPPRPLDAILEFALGGFRRWDAQYFMHIAEHGYTYENTLAFYPLFPGAVNICTRLLFFVCPLQELVTFRSLALLVAILLNLLAFVQASLCLQRLTQLVFQNPRITRIAVLMFAFNPAAVFFAAPYTESLFAWLTFATMELCQRKRYLQATVPLCLSLACRSNGTINCGFFVFHMLHDAIVLPGCGKHLLKLGAVLSTAALTFVAIQFYQADLFCQDKEWEWTAAVREYGAAEGFVMAGQFSKWNSSWCHSALPIPYGYVQSRYWDVGWFAYYQLKQLPNFLLAAPILWVFGRNCAVYMRQQLAETARYPMHLWYLFRLQRSAEQRLLVYMVHATVLTAICVCFVHIQVSTRLLASASPCLYWFGAAKWKDAKTVRKLLVRNRLVCAWFAGYFVIGTCLFSNFLPWT